MMADTIFFITDHSVQIDILHTAEDIFLNIRILLAQLPDQILDLRTLGTFFRTAAGSAAFRETTGTLDKMQIIVIHPVNDVLLAHQIQRTDQFHSRKIRAVQLRHHRLYLRPVKHSHKDGLDHIVKMMPQRNLVAAELLCLASSSPATMSKISEANTVIGTFKILALFTIVS